MKEKGAKLIMIALAIILVVVGVVPRKLSQSAFSRMEIGDVGVQN